MANSSEPVPIEYGVYSASDAAAMTSLLAETFVRHDPPAVAVGLSPAEFEAFVGVLCPRAAAAGLTIVARFAGTGELIGALLTEDSASPPPAGMDRLSAKFDPILDLLGQLDEEYRGGRSASPGESLHLFLVGVSERAAGRGVAQGLVTACLENGARKGYRMAVTEATNKVSQHIFRKLGFVPRAQRSYGTYRFQGREVFGSIAEQGGPILMDRVIGLDETRR